MRLTHVGIVFALLSSGLLAEQPQYPQPDLDNVPYSYDAVKNTLADLERGTMSTTTGRKGLTGKTEIVVVPGANATVRFSNADAPQFIIHLDNAKTEVALI